MLNDAHLFIQFKQKENWEIALSIVSSLFGPRFPATITSENLASGDEKKVLGGHFFVRNLRNRTEFIQYILTIDLMQNFSLPLGDANATIRRLNDHLSEGSRILTFKDPIFRSGAPLLEIFQKIDGAGRQIDDGVFSTKEEGMCFTGKRSHVCRWSCECRTFCERMLGDGRSHACAAR